MIVRLADEHPLDKARYSDELVEILSLSPAERLAGGLCQAQPATVGDILDSYAMFLDFMSQETN